MIWKIIEKNESKYTPETVYFITLNIIVNFRIEIKTFHLYIITRIKLIIILKTRIWSSLEKVGIGPRSVERLETRSSSKKSVYNPRLWWIHMARLRPFETKMLGRDSESLRSTAPEIWQMPKEVRWGIKFRLYRHGGLVKCRPRHDKKKVRGPRWKLRNPVLRISL